MAINSIQKNAAFKTVAYQEAQEPVMPVPSTSTALEAVFYVLPVLNFPG